MNAAKHRPDAAASLPKPLLRIATREGVRFVDVSDIYFLQAWSNYTFIHEKAGRVLSAKTLGSYEERLSSAQFFRPHQSYCINRDYIRTINFKTNEIFLQTGERIPISRYGKKIMKRTLV